jgi:hypothetical protein
MIGHDFNLSSLSLCAGSAFAARATVLGMKWRHWQKSVQQMLSRQGSVLHGKITPFFRQFDIRA